MRLINKIILTAAAVFLSWSAASAQWPERKFQYEFGVGYSIGATTPMDLPATIREINGYRPLANLSAGVSAIYMASPRWGASLGVFYENNGMQTRIGVKNYHLTMDVEAGGRTGTNTGYYTGSIRNRTDIGYISIPVSALFRPDENWQVELGPYFAFAVHKEFTGHVSEGTMRETPNYPKVGVNKATYDYSDDLRDFDFGVQLGASRRVWRGLAVKARVKWGLMSVLDPDTRQIDMNTYNVFLNLGVTYTL